MAYYPFDGNANDASGNGNNGIAQGVTLVPDGFGNSAYYFNGAAYIMVPNSTSLQVTGTHLTLAAWVNPTQFTGSGNDRTILRKMLQTGSSGGYLLRISPGGYIDFGIQFGYDVGSYLTARYGALSLNTWSHVAVTYDGAEVRFYLNGAIVDSASLTNSIASGDAALTIGVIDPYFSEEYFYGAIEEVRIYNRTLSDSETQQLFSGTP